MLSNVPRIGTTTKPKPIAVKAPPIISSGTPHDMTGVFELQYVTKKPCFRHV